MTNSLSQSLCTYVAFLSFYCLSAIALSTEADIAAWDCSIQNSKKYAEFSLMTVQDCSNVSNNYHLHSHHNVQLIQASQFLDLSVTRCQLKADFFVALCSYSYLTGYRLWDSQNVLAGVQIQLTKSECDHAIHEKVLRYQDREYYGKQSFIQIQLSPSITAEGWMTLRGDTSSNTGSCFPNSFYFGQNFYPSHILSMKYDVMVSIQHGVFNTKKRIIKVDGSVIPNQPSGYFFSPNLGNFFWEAIPNGNLSSPLWYEISEGKIDIYMSRLREQSPIALFENEITNQSLAFILKRETVLCITHSCRKAYELQIKDTYAVLFNTTGQSRLPLKEVSGTNVNKLENLHATLTSVFLNKELRLSSTFDKISRELCRISRNLILTNIKAYINQILMPVSNPENDVRMFIQTGSVLYGVQCHETTVSLRQVKGPCTDMVPISVQSSDNTTRDGFLDPLTHVIVPASKQQKCSDIFVHKYMLINKEGSAFWVCRSATGWQSNCKPPDQLSPLHTGSLFAPAEKDFNPTLYSKEQLDSVVELQWKDSLKSENLDEWNQYISSIKNMKPTVKSSKLFQSIDEIIKNFTNSFLHTVFFNLILRHLWPLLLAQYVIQITFSIKRAIVKIFKIYKTGGASKSLALQTPFLLFVALFPLPLSVDTVCACPCTEPNFISTVSKLIEDEERTKFLRNLE